MRVFVTGATGFIGTAVIKELQSNGHQVIGLARSEQTAASLMELGAGVHRGSLEDLESLRNGATSADGVIHLAFDNGFGDFDTIISNDQRAINAIGDALAGSGKPFVSTSVTTMISPQGRPATEDMKASKETPGFPRSSAEDAVIALAGRGIRSSVVRLAPCVHDANRQGFATALAYVAREKGVSAYVSDRTNRWPAVHRNDAAKLFRLALESAPAGTRLHGVGEDGILFSNIAEAIGRRWNLPVTGISHEAAGEHFGWLSPFVPFDNPVSSAKTQKLLNWKPEGHTLIFDIESK